MAEHALLRLRCPADSPREADRHLAIDVRLPCDLTTLAALAARLPPCRCGAQLGIAEELGITVADDGASAAVHLVGDTAEGSEG